MRGTWQGSGTWQTSGGGGGGPAVAAAVVVLVIAAAVIHAIWRTLVEAAEIAALTVVSIAGLTAVAGIGYLVYRGHRSLQRQDRRGRPIEARPVYQLPPEPRPQLEGSDKPPIGPAQELHLHLHGLTPDQISAIVTQRGAYPEEDR